MTKILCLGESLARMSSFNGERLTNSTQLDLNYGGAEANVAVNLSLLKHHVEYATKIPENKLSENLMKVLHSYNVSSKNVLYGGPRLGTYFLEVGSGLRPSSVIYDRAYSSISLMKEIEWDIDQLFEGITLFHITGVTLGLSSSWNELGVYLIQEAKKRGIEISFDMNYRQKLWTQEEAKIVFEKVLPLVDYLSAGNLDAIHFMDVEEIENASWDYYTRNMAEKYPNLKYIYGTNRDNLTPNSFIINGYVLDVQNNEPYESKQYRLDTVVDRVGAGDSYASGILDGIINDSPIQETVEFGMAASVLKHTVKGDINQFSRREIESFMSNTQNILR